MAVEFTVAPVRSSDELAAIADLFRGYEASLDIDLDYQGFAAELAGLPGKYAPPSGELLLAKGSDGTVLGCIALRPLGKASQCEMKRLYVAPEGRGMGLGRSLVGELIQVASRIGYEEMWLDTLPTMTSAQLLYRTMGFEQADPYYDTPVAGTVFLRLKLTG